MLQKRLGRTRVKWSYIIDWQFDLQWSLGDLWSRPIIVHNTYPSVSQILKTFICVQNVIMLDLIVLLRSDQSLKENREDRESIWFLQNATRQQYLGGFTNRFISIFLLPKSINVVWILKDNTSNLEIHPFIITATY